LTRNGRIEEDLIDQLFNSSEKRLARVLLLLANFGKDGRPEPIVGKFSQETLAEMIGTTRSRVSFFMNRFRKLGYIEYNGKLEIHNSLLNVACTTSRRSRGKTRATGRNFPIEYLEMALRPQVRATFVQKDRLHEGRAVDRQGAAALHR
jgi:hypothetical protein